MDLDLVILKIILTAAIVLGLTSISERFTKLAGFLAAVPTISLIISVFSYIQYGQEFDTVKFYKGMLAGMPILALFYLPFLFIKNFYFALFTGFLTAVVFSMAYNYFDLI